MNIFKNYSLYRVDWKFAYFAKFLITCYQITLFLTTGCQYSQDKIVTFDNKNGNAICE